MVKILSFSHNVFHLNKGKNHNSRNIEIVVCNCFEFSPVQKKSHPEGGAKFDPRAII